VNGFDSIPARVVDAEPLLVLPHDRNPDRGRQALVEIGPRAVPQSLVVVLVRRPGRRQVLDGQPQPPRRSWADLRLTRRIETAEDVLLDTFFHRLRPLAAEHQAHLPPGNQSPTVKQMRLKSANALAVRCSDRFGPDLSRESTLVLREELPPGQSVGTFSY